MHPKTADGKDSLEPDAVAAAVAAVREALPGLPLGVTTGFWALPDADARRRAVEGWTVLPDFASLNWHEPGSPELAEVLLGKGLGVEIGLFHAEAAASWAESDMAQHCMRVMIELQADEDVAVADDMLARVLAVGFARAGAAARARRKLLAATGTRRGAWACRPASAWRTRCGCPTVRRHRTTPRWCRRRWRCSVGRGGQREVGEVEARHHDAAHQRGLVVTGAGALPVPRWDQQLRLLTRVDVAAEQKRCRASCSALPCPPLPSRPTSSSSGLPR